MRRVLFLTAPLIVCCLVAGCVRGKDATTETIEKARDVALNYRDSAHSFAGLDAAVASRLPGGSGISWVDYPEMGPGHVSILRDSECCLMLASESPGGIYFCIAVPVEGDIGYGQSVMKPGGTGDCRNDDWPSANSGAGPA